MSRPTPFPKKRIRRTTDRQLQKRSVKKPQSKARLRRAFESEIHDLVDRLIKFPRVRGAAERERHLRAAIETLDHLIEEKPQSNLLRTQRQHCLDALREVMSDPPRADSAELPLPLADPEGILLVLKARLHPPASDRESWN